MMKYRILILLTFLFSGCATTFPPLPYDVGDHAESLKRVRGVMHVHTGYSHDSKFSIEEVIKTARKTNLDFVVVTDHNTLYGKEVYEAFRKPGDPLLVFGAELTTDVGHLLFLGTNEIPAVGTDPQEAIDFVKSRGGYVFLSHPASAKNPWRDPDVHSIDGLEVYNFAHDVYVQNKAGLATKMLFLPPSQFLKNFQKNPEAGLELWNKMEQDQTLVAISGADSHVKFNKLGVSIPNKRLQFQATTLYLLVPSVIEGSIVRAIGQGRSFMAFENLGVAESFRFGVRDENKIYFPGDIFQNEGRTVKLRVEVPKRAMIQILRDGVVIESALDRSLEFVTKYPGRYRVEVYQEDRLWIFTNPIQIL